MTVEDWRAVIDGAADMGVGMVQFIGGEPTLHPAFANLVGHALGRGLHVEVYTNLYRVSPALWELFERPGVRVATSYYSDEGAEHDEVTGRRGSHGRTRANIVEALRRSVPLRVGVVDLDGTGTAERARAELEALGVVDVGVDRARAFGRAAAGAPDPGDTCGRCGHGSARIGPDGTVTPCVFTRHAVAGNVRDGLAGILSGAAFRSSVDELDRVRSTRAGRDPQCGPDATCDPSCSPSDTGNKGGRPPTGD